jgi:hypothetical protein
LKKGTWIIVVFCVAVLAALVYTSLGNRQYRCEVCITFNGVKNCRISSARTRESAQRTASENACAEMEHNMTDRMTCPNTPPDSVKWLSVQ